MDKDLIRLLKSSNPSDRIKGINRLVDNGHPDARRIIGALYKKETDETVKEAAQEAARRLKAQASGGGTKRDPASAQKYLESAMGALIDLRNDDAWELAAQAFRADPSLAEDDYALGLAGEITGLDREQAIDALLAHNPVAEAKKSKTKNDDKTKNSDVERVGWGSALAWIGGYSALVAIVISIPFFIFSSVIGIFFAAFDSSVDTSEIVSSLGLLGAGIAVATLVSMFLYMLIYYGMVHFAAKSILGGDGYYTNLLKTVSLPLIAQFIVQLVIYGIMFGILGTALTNLDPVALDAAIQTSDMSYIPGIEQNLGLINGLNALISLVGLGFFWWITQRIGDNYDFGWFKGCFAQIIPFFLIVGLMCVCSMALSFLGSGAG